MLALNLSANRCHIAFTFHVYDLPVISVGGRSAGGVTGEMAAKPVTVV